MAILFANNASTTISGAITAAATTVALAAGTGANFPQPTGGNYYVATFYDQSTKTIYEIVHVTAMAGDVATIVRAQEGTTARAWNAGDIFANLVTAGTLNNFVQAGTGPANTSLIYVGTDVGTPNHIVATTNPVPPSLAVGMQFNIKVANTNLAATDASLNGLAAIPLKRTDGSDLVGNNIVNGEEIILVYNGSTLSTMIPPIPQPPPQNTFYVNPSGNDNNSGFADTSAAAFQTIQGAINAIKARYISANTITIRVHDGTYSNGFEDSTSYIASWAITGNQSNPGNCIINATSTNGASYLNGSPAGRCVVCYSTANMSVSGFTFQSYLENAAASAGGVLSLYNCNFTAPTSGLTAPIDAYSGSAIDIAGTNGYTGLTGCPGLIAATGGSSILLGYHDYYNTTTCTFNIQATPTFSQGTLIANSSAMIYVYNEAISFTGGVPIGPAYNASSGGGILWTTSNIASVPGTQPGIVTTPGWITHP